MVEIPERWTLGAGLDASRIICGLWQVADIEKYGSTIDPERGADALAAYAAAGFDTFDMADHYGSAELIAGRLLSRWKPPGRRPLAFTKWCPEPGPMTARDRAQGVRGPTQARLGVDKVDLLQFHWWTFQHPAWLDALHELAALRAEGLIDSIGVTNFDTDHLRVALADGIPIATNQVSFSLIDRRAAGDLSAFCLDKGVRLLAYGTLCGGFLSDKWLRQPEPAAIPDWSRSKYKRFIDVAGGWGAFQGVLEAAHEVAGRHGVSIANVATRWVLDHPAVAATIIGARLGETEHRDDTAKLFSFALDADDRAILDLAFATTKPIPGDCGDEYRRPPYLTATGDLSHHLKGIASVYTAEPVPGFADRSRVSSGSIWESLAGYSRAVRVKDTIRVSGTSPRPTVRAGSSRRAIRARRRPTSSTRSARRSPPSAAAWRMSFAPGSISATSPTGSRCRAPTACFWRHPRPGRNTLIQAGNLVGDYEVEIEAEAIVE